MPSVVTNALVLRRADYRDYDRMVTLISPNLGRIEAVARGCRRTRSPLLNATEPFVAGEYILNEVKGRLSVSQCRISEDYYGLRGDLDKLQHGAYLLHLLGNAALPGVPCEELFLLTLRALAHLCYAELPNPLVTAAFEMHYMSLLGMGLRMDACTICGRAVEGAARFSLSRGGVLCETCARDEPILANGARRILLRVPRTKFEAVAKLDGHPDWPRAAAIIRDHVARNIDPPKIWPSMWNGDA